MLSLTPADGLAALAVVAGLWFLLLTATIRHRAAKLDDLPERVTSVENRVDSLEARRLQEAEVPERLAIVETELEAVGREMKGLQRDSREMAKKADAISGQLATANAQLAFIRGRHAAGSDADA